MIRMLAAVIGIVLACSACEAPGEARDELSRSAARYERGDLTGARRLAEPLVTTTGPRSDEAAWIVGLCDYRDGKLGSARQRFRYVTTGTDLPLAAQARVTLAQIDLAEGDAGASLANLARAWPDLPEAQHRPTAECGIAAAQAAGDRTAEILWSTRMPAAPARTTPELAAVQKRFTLQSGAFRNLPGARVACSTLAERPGVRSLGTPRILTRQDRRGDPLYLVQVGSFATRDAANAARAAVPSAALMVVAQ